MASVILSSGSTSGSGASSPGITGTGSGSLTSTITATSTSTASSYNEADTARRSTLSVVVACLLQEAGFVTVEKAVLGTLVEILQSTIVELGRSARGYSELAYRTEPLVADIILALADMGINYDGLQVYSRRPNRTIVPQPSVQPDSRHHTVLQVGDKKPHLPYIPDSLPPFPDTHTYCFTPTVKQPVTEYEAIREKAATQKRDIERALTRFGTKTNITESLFIAEDKEFALVCVQPAVTQNVDALMPRDQVFEAEHDYTAVSSSKARRKRQNRLNNLQQQQQQQQLKQDQDDGNQVTGEVKLPEPVEADSMDNPYLRTVKMPRKSSSRSGRHHHNHHHRHHHQQEQQRTLENSSPKESLLGPNISRIVLGSANHSSTSDGGSRDGGGAGGNDYSSNNNNNNNYGHTPPIINASSLLPQPLSRGSMEYEGNGVVREGMEGEFMRFDGSVGRDLGDVSFSSMGRNGDFLYAIGSDAHRVDMLGDRVLPSAVSADVGSEDRHHHRVYQHHDDGFDYGIGSMSSASHHNDDMTSPPLQHDRHHSFGGDDARKDVHVHHNSEGRMEHGGHKDSLELSFAERDDDEVISPEARERMHGLHGDGMAH